MERVNKVYKRPREILYFHYILISHFMSSVHTTCIVNDVILYIITCIGKMKHERNLKIVRNKRSRLINNSPTHVNKIIWEPRIYSCSLVMFRDSWVPWLAKYNQRTRPFKMQKWRSSVREPMSPQLLAKYNLRT